MVAPLKSIQGPFLGNGVKAILWRVLTLAGLGCIVYTVQNDHIAAQRKSPVGAIHLLVKLKPVENRDARLNAFLILPVARQRVRRHSIGGQRADALAVFNLRTIHFF